MNEREKMHVDGLEIQGHAKRVAEELGFGPDGKIGGVILVVIDAGGDPGMIASVHAGGGHPLFDAMRGAIREVVKHAVELLAGGKVESSVQQWRKGTKRS